MQRKKKHKKKRRKKIAQAKEMTKTRKSETH
jgi:hypothetical protein